jgi:hypothetical protein
MNDFSRAGGEWKIGTEITLLKSSNERHPEREKVISQRWVPAKDLA